MKYFYSKYKFTTSLFYKKLEKGTVKVYSDCFYIEIFPFFQYTGYYFKHSTITIDQNKTIYRTMIQKDNLHEINLKLINPENEYYIAFYKSKGKISIFKSDYNGIILKF